MSEPVDWRQIDNVLHRTGAVSDCIGRPGVLEVAKSTYEQLLQTSHDYYKLRQALIAGGVNDDALDTLIQGFRDDTTTATEHIWSKSTENWVTYPSVPFVTKHPKTSGHASIYDHKIPEFKMPNPPATPLIRSEGNSSEGTSRGNPSANPWDKTKSSSTLERLNMYALKDRRTLTFSNLPSNATLKDVTRMIKGGRLIELHLRTKDRKANVMFAEGAAEYFKWAHSNDIYIGAKRIEVSWAEHQSNMHRQIPSKLENGNTRNIVIRNAGNRVNEEEIRSDLEHIDKLVITDITTNDQDIVISTNSIHLAGYAKLCMTSRAKYRGMNFSWFPDECAEPIPIRSFVPRAMASIQDKPLPPPPPSATNRFMALEWVEGSDIASTDEKSDEESDTSGIDIKPRSTATASP